MRNAYERELKLLNNQLVEMGVLIEDAIDAAISALLDRKVSLAEAVMEQEIQIDEKEKEIQALCMKLLLRQQPVAGDLRKISSALKMVTDMERIGDQSCDIAEISLRLPKDLKLQKVEHIREMAKACTKMVKDCIDAYVKQNLALSHKVIEDDDIVDGLFCHVKEELVRIVRDDTGDVETAIDLLMIAKYFERIGDHAVNIAGWVIFSITGG